MLGLHPEEHVEHDRIGGNLFAFYVEMMFREGDPVVAVFVEVTGLFAQIGEHPLIKVSTPARHSSADLGLVANARQVKYSDFHFVTSFGNA
jgi:hypothetical protein